MRTYLILKERAQRWNADAEIRGLLGETGLDRGLPSVISYSPNGRDALLAHKFDRGALAAKGLAYERLDQLTMEVLLGVR